MKFAKFMILMVFAAACYATDLGTKENPLTIGSVQELLQFRNAVLDSGTYKGVKLQNAGEGLHFKLTADLDLSPVCGRDVGNWEAIGPFEGSFDGDGHKISNLYIDDSLGYVGNAGFIGPVFNNGSDTLYYSNVVFENTYIRHSGLVGTFVTQVVTGQAVLRNNSVELIYETVDNDQGALQWGGLMGNTVAKWVGFYDNTIKGTMNVSNQKQAAVGGVIGVLVDPGAIERNVNEANITVKGHINADVGGVVGELLAPCTFKDNVNKGNLSVNVSTETGFVGGLAGVILSFGSEKTMTGNFNYGKVELTASYAALGGLFGYVSGNTNTVLDSCVNYGDVIYNGVEEQQMVQVGGVAGIWEVKQASFVENKGKISVENAKAPFVGGIAGYVRPGAKSADLFKAVNEGDIEIKTSADSVNGWISGLVGSTDQMEYLRLDSCINKGNILLPVDVEANALVVNPFASTYNSDVQLLASTSVNEGDVPSMEPREAIVGLRHAIFTARTWKNGTGSFILEVTGLTSAELGHVRVQMYSLDGRRLPVSVTRSGNLFVLATTVQKGVVRLKSPYGNKTLMAR